MDTIIKTVEENIERIRAKIVADYAFLTEFLPETTIVDESVKTIQTNGREIRCNPRFIYSRSFTDQMFFYIHEVAHNFLGHPIRIRPEHDFDTAQEAADYVTNDLLDDAGFALPRDALIDFRYRGKSYEEVYELLKKQKDSSPCPNSKRDRNKQGTVMPAPPDSTSDGSDPHEKPGDDPLDKRNNTDSKKDLEERIAKHEQKQLSAMQTAEMMGNIPGDLQRRFNKLKERPVDWRVALPTEIDTIMGMDDYSFVVPNNNIDDETFIYPGMVGSKNKPIAIFVDTSISVGVSLLESMCRDVVSVISNAEPEKVFILGIDTEVKSFQEFDGEETDILERIALKGGGGTDFRPGFSRIQEVEDEIGACIYLTDGFCSLFPLIPPDYPVIWLIYGKNNHFTPPFGRVIKMD